MASLDGLPGLVLFGIERLDHAVHYYGVLYGANGFGMEGVHAFLNIEMLIIGIAGIVFSMPVYHVVKRWVTTSPAINAGVQNALRLGFQVVLLALLVISASYIAADAYNPFIYFRF